MKPPSNQVFDRLTAHYASKELQPVEFRLLQLLRKELHQMRVLDLGVGAGRTAHTLARLAKSYVGVDYSKKMIERCKSDIGESETVRFLWADAADLSVLGKQKFDLVIFSFNGIDSISVEHRNRVLAEIGRVLKPEGIFFFSTHCLDAVPYSFEIPWTSRNPLRFAWRLFQQVYVHLRIRYENRRVNWVEARKKGWALLQDGAHGFGLVHYYTTVENQNRELQGLGFKVEKVWDAEGGEVAIGEKSRAPWNYFLCTKLKKRARRAA